MKTISVLLLLVAGLIALVATLHVIGMLRNTPLGPEVLTIILPALLLAGLFAIPGFILLVISLGRRS